MVNTFFKKLIVASWKQPLVSLLMVVECPNASSAET